MTSGNALLDIINDILDYSKIEANKMELEHVDFDLTETIEKMCDLTALKAHEKNLEFIVMIYPEIPSMLRGDPGRLRQILINLTGNAIKFTEKGEIFIRVKLVDEDRHRATIRFSVSDTGIGIPTKGIGEAVQIILTGQYLHQPEIWRHRAGPDHLKTIN